MTADRAPHSESQTIQASALAPEKPLQKEPLSPSVLQRPRTSVSFRSNPATSAAGLEFSTVIASPQPQHPNSSKSHPWIPVVKCLLQRNQWIQRFPGTVIAELLAHVEIVKLPEAGEVVLDSCSRDIHWILHGSLDVVQAKDGEVLAELTPGTCFPELAPFFPSPLGKHVAYCVPVSCTVAVLKADFVQSILTKISPLLWSTGKLQTERLYVQGSKERTSTFLRGLFLSVSSKRAQFAKNLLTREYTENQAIAMHGKGSTFFLESGQVELWIPSASGGGSSLLAAVFHRKTPIAWIRSWLQQEYPGAFLRATCSQVIVHEITAQTWKDLVASNGEDGIQDWIAKEYTKHKVTASKAHFDTLDPEESHGRELLRKLTAEPFCFRQDQARQLLSFATWISFKPNQTIVRKGDLLDCVLLSISGNLPPILGVSAFFSEVKEPADVVAAATTCSVARIPNIALELGEFRGKLLAGLETIPLMAFVKSVNDKVSMKLLKQFTWTSAVAEDFWYRLLDHVSILELPGGLTLPWKDLNNNNDNNSMYLISAGKVRLSLVDSGTGKMRTLKMLVENDVLAEPSSKWYPKKVKKRTQTLERTSLIMLDEKVIRGLEHEYPSVFDRLTFKLSSQESGETVPKDQRRPSFIESPMPPLQPMSALQLLAKYLSLADCLHCRLVCRKWNQLFTSCLPIHALPIREDHQDTPLKIQFLIPAIGAHLQSLELLRVNSMSDTLFQHITTHCVHLRKLTLVGFKYAQNATCVKHVLSNFPRLEELNWVQGLKSASIADDVVRDLGICNLSQLRALNLGLWAVTPGLLKMILRASPYLESLKLTHCHNFDVTCMEQIAMHCKRLRKLVLISVQHLDDLALKVAAATLHDLEVLDISDCRTISDLGISFFAHSGSLQTLCSLNLSKCRELTDRSICGLDTPLDRLETIDLSHTFLTDLSVQHLATYAPGLQHVDISFCPRIGKDMNKYFSAENMRVVRHEPRSAPSIRAEMVSLEDRYTTSSVGYST